MMKIHFYSLCKTILSLALLTLPLCNCNGGQIQQADQTPTETEEPKDTTKYLTMVFAGDLMQHMPQINSARVKGGYDYTECFRYIKSQIEYADVAVGNFETTLAGPPYSSYPKFCTPDDFLRDVKATGFDILLSANNHVCDKGRLGVDRTIQMMDSLHIPHLGSYVDAEAREKQYPFLLEKNGFRIVFLNYTYGTNGMPVIAPNVINLIDKEVIAKDIERSKQMNPDAIIAFMHWGEEYFSLPVQSQKDMADWLFEQGVTHIIGSHPHVPEPIEMRTDDKGGKHVLAYSLGNFVSNQSRENTYGGMLVHLKLEKDSTTRVNNCDYSLYFVTRPVMSGHKSHRVYDINTPDTVLSSGERRLRDSFLKSNRPLFEKYNVGIKERRK